LVNPIEILSCILNEYGHPEIGAANLDQLVERLTHHQFIDIEFTTSFLLTYRFFTTPKIFLQCLRRRFSETPTAKGEENSTQDKENIQRLVQHQVSQVLIRWVKSRVSSYDFDDIQSEFNKEALSFIDELKQNPYCSPNIILSLEQRLKRGPGSNEPLSPFSPLGYTQAKVVSSQAELPLADDISIMMGEGFSDIRGFDVQIISNLLTSIDYEIFKRIHPCEFLKQGWNNSNSDKLAPNINAMTTRFNDIGNWVVYEVLTGQTPKDRVQFIMHFVQVAKMLHSMNNFNGMCAILSGLNNASVIRLKRTFMRLAKKEKSTCLEELTKLVQGEENFRSLREMWASVEPPAIPFLAITLKDLTFLEDGNPDHLEGGGINFYKWRKIAEVIQLLLEYQHLPYTIETNNTIQSYVHNKIEIAKQLGSKGLHKLSSKCE